MYLTTQKKKNLSEATEGSEVQLPDFAITHLKNHKGSALTLLA